jgi:hypothetical protein
MSPTHDVGPVKQIAAIPRTHSSSILPLLDAVYVKKVGTMTTETPKIATGVHELIGELY